MSWYGAIGNGISQAASWVGSKGSSMLSSGALSLPDFFGMNYVLNRHSAKEAYRREKYMYLLDRDYHSPANQMSLLKQAHLNPNLIYGESNPGSVATHQFNVGSAAPSGLRGGYDPIAKKQGQLLDAQIDKVKSDKNVSDTNFLKGLLEYMDLKNFGASGNSSVPSQVAGMVKRLVPGIMGPLGQALEPLAGHAVDWSSRAVRNFFSPKMLSVLGDTGKDLLERVAPDPKVLSSSPMQVANPGLYSTSAYQSASKKSSKKKGGK